MVEKTIAGLEELGTVFLAAEGGLFDLGRRDALWLVLEGKIDIFVCAKTRNEELGARYHIVRIEQGQAAFGMELRQPAMAYVAAGVPGTRLLQLPLDHLGEKIASHDEQARSLLENWVETLSARFCAGRIPSTFVDAWAHSVIRITDEARAIVSPHGVRWVRHRSGESSPLGDARLSAVNGSGYFPVSRTGWLQAACASELHAVSTFSLPEVDRAWQGLHGFHAVVAQMLHLERMQALEGERNQIRQRSSLDAATLENALRRLTAPIQRPRHWQDEEKSCSHPIFSAMQMVAAEMSIKLTPPVELLQNLKVSDPAGLIAKASAIRLRKVALKGSWWKHAGGAMLCFTVEDSRPIAVLIKSPSRVEAYDPSTGAFARVTAELVAELNPIAYTLYRRFPSRALNGVDLLRFGLSRCKGDLLLIFVTGVAVGVLAVVTPYVTGVIFDRLIPGAELGQLAQASMLLFAAAVASSLFMFVRGFATLRLQGKMDSDIQAAVWDRLLSLPVSFFRDYSSGDLAQRSMGISQIRDILTGSALNAMLSGIFSLFSFALLFYYSVHLALIATGLVLTAFFVSFAGGFAQLPYRRDALRLSGGLSSKLLQFVNGMAKFRVSGTEGRAFAAWAREFSEQKQNTSDGRRIANLVLVFNAVFPTIALAVIFYANARSLAPGGAHSLIPGQTNELSTGDFLAFIAAFLQFLMAGIVLSGTLISVLNVVPVYERTKPILQATPETSHAKTTPGLLAGDIEISHVSFSYRVDTPLVLRDLSLHIRAGQSIAFVGSSGCGKSTLLRILLGFEAPNAGTVYFDGQDLAGLDIQAVRRQIGVVLQTSRPISGTIFENVVGSAPLSVNDAMEACKLAGLEEDIKRMPMGLHTIISDGGGGISGGQRQRLMIARAIVGKPRILLFDEATSALDNRTQAIVSESLAGLRATRVVIAHRLSTVIHADRIFVLDKGAVAESGTYTELMQEKGLFHELAQRQLI